MSKTKPGQKPTPKAGGAKPGAATTGAGKTGSAKPGTATSSTRTRWVAIGIAGLVVIALVVALVVAGGGDDDDASGDGSAATTVAPGQTSTPGQTSAPGATSAPSGSIEEVRPVTITGEPLPEFEGSEGDAAIGLAAPRLDGASFDGTPVSTTFEAPTMLVFLSHSCPHCQAEVPRLVEWFESGQAPAGLEVIAVATNTNKDYPNYPPSEWLEREDWPWKVIVDDENSSAFHAYGFPAFPAFAFVGADGKVTLRTTGEVPVEAIDQYVRTTFGL